MKADLWNDPDHDPYGFMHPPTDHTRESGIEMEKKGVPIGKRKRVVGGRHTPNYKERREIKRVLGMLPQETFVRCPAKKKITAYRLNYRQDPDWERKYHEHELPPGFINHMVEKHKCPDCQCHYTAGQGTDHYGWGWCYMHEKGIRGAIKDEFALSHKQALQNGHPMKYTDPEGFIQRMADMAGESQTRVELLGELNAVRGLMEEVMVRHKDSNERNEKALQTLSDLRDAIEGAELDPDQAQQMVDALKAIQKNLMQGDTFKDRANILLKASKEIRGIAIDKLGIDTLNMVPYDEMKQYVWQIVRELFSRIPDEDSKQEAVRKLREIPEPKANIERRK